MRIDYLSEAKSLDARADALFAKAKAGPVNTHV